ncbi:MAG: nicotinate-nucleotide adenylyltransferase [Bacteroidales bacterium]|nr:nicotinate-nucleotide adenylyltransferase [Bacteroidales bacterium]
MILDKTIQDIFIPDNNRVEKYKKNKTGLFFGSFNPVHNGHLIIANYILEFTGLEQIFFVVSPQNPFKEKASLLEDYHRLALVKEAIGDTNKYYACDIEFKMPKPSYTIDTLTYLKEKYPEKEFSLIMGCDNFKSFHKWKNSKQIIGNHNLYVYPRPGFDTSEFNDVENITIVEAPLMEISSTFIRKAVKEKKDIRFFMPERAWRYMKEMHFYEK